MWFSTFPSVAFIILGLIGSLSTVVVASKLCDDPSTIETISTIDLTKDEQDWFHCYSSLEGSTANNCYDHLTPADTKTTTVASHLYNTSTNETTSAAFTLKMEGNPGIYTFVTDDTRKATGYITDSTKDKKCITMFKCFTGGSWGGSESNGEYATILCNDPEVCYRTKYMRLRKDIKSKLLTGNAELKKLNQDECRSKGIQP